MSFAFSDNRANIEALAAGLKKDVRAAIKYAITGAARAWVVGGLGKGHGLPARTSAGAMQRFRFTPRIAVVIKRKGSPSLLYSDLSARQYGKGVAYRSPRSRSNALALLEVAKLLAGRGNALAVVQKLAAESKQYGIHAADAVRQPGGHRITARKSGEVIAAAITLPAFNKLSQVSNGRGAIYQSELRDMSRGGDARVMREAVRRLFRLRLRELRS